MNYSEMSNLEINCAVGKAISFADFLLARNGQVEYCKSWADAGPIIQENGIELNYDGISWSAAARFCDVGWYSDWKNHPESPLRLAMIVFLMIKDKEDKNESH